MMGQWVELCQITKNEINLSYRDNSIMDILDIFGHFYLNHLSPYFFTIRQHLHRCGSEL